MVSVSPVVGSVEGATTLLAVVNGLSDGAPAWCKQGRVVVEASTKSSAGVVECVSVAGVAGNTTVEVSGNGQEFTEGSGVVVELVGGMNVTSVSQRSVMGGSVVMVQGSGFSAARGVQCAVGGSSADGSSWAYVAAVW